MATKTTAAAGNLSDGTRWVGGVAPVDGDDLFLNHSIDQDVDFTAGASGVLGSVGINWNTANVVYKVKAGKTLRLRGDGVYKGSYGVETNCFVMEPGSTLIYDSSQAAAPSTTPYRIRPNGGGTCASVLIGSDGGSTCVITSDPGGANGYFDRNGHGATGNMRVYNADLSRLGSATVPLYEIQHGDNGVNANKTIFKNCIIDGCGEIAATNAMQANGTWDMSGTTVRNSLHATRSVNLPTATASGTTKTLSGAVFDKQVALSDGAWEVGGNAMFLQSVSIGSRSVKAVQTGSTFLRSITQPTTNGWGDLLDSYFLKDVSGGAFSNPHLWQIPAWADCDVRRCVFEYNGTASDGDCLAFATPGVTRTANIANNVMVPNASGNPLGKFISLGGGANMRIRYNHNTFISDVGAGGSNETGAQWGEAGGEPVVEECKSNLAWSATADRALIIGRLAGTVQNVVSAANCDKNATWNGHNGSDGVGFDSVSAGQAWTGDPDATSVAVTSDPFVARTRNIAAWDASLGGPGTATHAIAEMAKRNDRSGFDSRFTPTALLAFVLNGFRVTDAALENAGHDGATIGAMGYVQMLRPASDVAAGGWTTQTGSATGLAAVLDDTPVDDATYVTSSPGGGAATLQMESGQWPVAGTISVGLRVRRA